VHKFIDAKNSNVVSTKLGDTWWRFKRRSKHPNFSQ